MFSQQFYTQRIFRRLAKALIRQCVCAGWSETLLVAHTTFLEISCHGSNVSYELEILIQILMPPGWPRQKLFTLHTDWTDLQYQARGHHRVNRTMLEDLDLFLRERLCWYGHVNGSSGAVRAACDKELFECAGQGGPGWCWRNWLRMTAVNACSCQSTAVTGTSGDQVWDLLCLQLVSYLEGWAH